MAKTLKDLSAFCRKLDRQVSEQSNALSIEVAETILAELTVKTPVDTSKAISNWQVELNKPADGYIEAHYKGKQGSTWTESAAESYERGKKVLLNKKPGDSIHLTNNAPYINRLNEGYSYQAPAGFIERCVMIGRKAVKGFKGKIKV